ncbi:YhcN/YlaJ family sporulation lipoprotein [Bacillus sp. B15-48]|uniref:YhcN/YlaJ family sporulation lipoprotein n=1 Tax=Bacillus sp. B15-48 TaxID=1548601 RepID=UPI00193FC3FE|nr:YhcN/YlaJ family sporulation lipoprotein [Bacillus sp. B15-48]MBM4764090.1 hypothetical protein [Bacillus sp. B15-48]
MQKKRLLQWACLALAFHLAGCSVSSDEELNPKTMDFTGRDTIGENNSFDSTNGVEINGDNTSNLRDEQRIQMNQERYEQIINSQTKITLEEITADQVALMDGILDAIILETDNNAYVALQLQINTDSISEELRKKITHVVQANVEQADSVFISGNPEFYQRMQSYEQAIKYGEHTDSFIHDFAETIRRIFPDAR